MGNEISEIERKVLAVIQHGLPQTRTPYKDMAQQAGIETNELLEVLRNWQKQHKLRRIGAIVHHLRAGLAAGAMVVWRVEQEDVERIGKTLAEFKQVSHAYERIKRPDWPYNIYTMVHGASDEELQQTIERMSRECGVTDYRVLTTERELRKVPPTYIIPKTQ